VGKYKRKRRVGRGLGSGRGKTAGRGTKGAGSRSGSGGSINASREGGQLPLFRRVPKRGFSNAKFMIHYSVVNIKALDEAFESGARIDTQALIKAKLIRSAKAPVKVLGFGETNKKFQVTAAAFTASAKEKITNAGGAATVG
jgi:large subunit ribosomal protein L15